MRQIFEDGVSTTFYSEVAVVVIRDEKKDRKQNKIMTSTS
jgi:hypothetical protein